MPTPISISSSASEKVGVPVAGTVQLVGPIPIKRVRALTRSPERNAGLEVGVLLGGGADDLLDGALGATPFRDASGRPLRTSERKDAARRFLLNGKGRHLSRSAALSALPCGRYRPPLASLLCDSARGDQQ